MPRSDHLVAAAQAPDGPVADRDQERLAGHGRVSQYLNGRLGRIDSRRLQRRRLHRHRPRIALRRRHPAQQRADRHVHRRALPVAPDDQPVLRSCCSEHRVRTTLAFAQSRKLVQAIRLDRQHVSFLRLVAPDLERTHRAVEHGNRGQVDARSPTGAMHQFRQRVRQPPGSDIVHRQDRIVRAQRGARVDHLLRPPLHFRVATLHRVEVKLLGIGAAADARRGSAPEADPHSRPAQLHQQRPDRQRLLVDLLGADAADAARDHDRFVVADPLACHVLLEGAEVAQQIGPPELVVERGCPDRPFQHDLARVADSGRKAIIGAVAVRVDPRHVAVRFPRCAHSRQPQIRDTEAAQPSLRAGPAASGRLIADFAAGAGRCAGKRRNGGRVIMGLDLEHDVLDLVGGPVQRGRIVGRAARRQAARRASLQHRGVVAVGDQRSLGCRRVRGADQVEQRIAPRLAVDRPAGVEDLVTAVLGVDLREHHQLHVGRVATRAGKCPRQVVDLLGRQGQSELDVGTFQGASCIAAQFQARQCLALSRFEQPPHGAFRLDDRFGHPVVQMDQQRFAGPLRRGAGRLIEAQQHPRAALDAHDPVESAVAGDVGGLA